MEIYKKFALVSTSSSFLYKCSECQYTTKHGINLHNHLKTHIDPLETISFSCELCSLSFTSKKSLNIHILEFHKFSHKRTENLFLKNVKRFENKKENRQLGRNSFGKNTTLKGLSRLLLKNKPFRCNQCDFSSKYKKYFELHKSKHELEDAPSVTKTNFLCSSKKEEKETEKYDIPIVSDLTIQNTQNNVKELLVPGKTELLVNDEFIRNPTYNSFIEDKPETRNSKHSNKSTNLELYRCKTCGFLTKFEKYFDMHMAQHIEIVFDDSVDKIISNETLKTEFKLDEFNCIICKVVARDQKSLDLHMSKHIAIIKPTNNATTSELESFSIKNLNSSKCKSEKLKKLTLKTGIQSNKPFKCKKCYFATKHKENFKLHLKKHVNVNRNSSNRAFKCDHKNCDFTTNSKRYFELHTNKHLNYKKVVKDSLPSNKQSSFRCTFCPFTALSIINLKYHIRIHLEHTYSKTWMDKVECSNVNNRFKDQLYCLPIKNNPPIYQNSLVESADLKVLNPEKDVKKECKTLNNVYDDNKDIQFGDNFKCFTNNINYLEIHNQDHLKQIEKNMLSDLNTGEVDGIFDQAPIDKLKRKETMSTKIKTVEKTNPQIEKLRTLQEKNKNQLFYCKNCNFKSRYEKYLLLHEKKHEFEAQSTYRPYNCSKCNFSTNFKNLYLVHEEKHNLPNSQPGFEPSVQPKKKYIKKANIAMLGFYNCTRCSFSCSLDTNFFIQRHIDKHKKDDIETLRNSFNGLYKCTKCRFVTMHKEAFELHALRYNRTED